MGGFSDLPRQFGGDLACKENDVCDILQVGPGGSKKTTELRWRDLHFVVVSKLPRMQLGRQRGNYGL